MEDVDIVVPGHGGITTQQSFLYVRDFLVALKERVLEQMVAGKGIEEILETVTMEDFSDYGWFDQWIRANVITMWELMYHYREPTIDPGLLRMRFPDWFPRRRGRQVQRALDSRGPNGSFAARVAHPGDLRKNALEQAHLVRRLRPC